MTKTIALTAAAIAVEAQFLGARFDDPALPDRLSVERTSPFFDHCYRDVGLLFDGIERVGDVQEYCISEGWIDIRTRNTKGKFRLDSNGVYVLDRLEGRVEPFWKRPRRQFLPGRFAPAAAEAAKVALDAAEAKRARKAEKMRRLADNA